MMTKVQTWQHIYTNVEKEQSPHNRGGFQTLFYTTLALTESEVEEMEARLLYFPSLRASAHAPIAPIKRLFFTTSTGKRVVAQIVPLVARDRLGRKGRYLAHSLVFASEAFARFGADPFRLFRDFPFANSVADALECGDFQTGDMPALSLDLAFESEQDLKAAKNWPLLELKKLTLLALRAERMAQKRLMVAFVGNSKQVESTVAVAFLAVPTPLRPHCTFDTYFYRCNPVSTYYWAVGLLESPTSTRFTVVDTHSRRVRGAITDQPESAYERWVMDVMKADNLDFIAGYKDHAFALCNWLEGHAYDLSLLDAVPPEVITSVFEVNTQQVRARLRQKLEEQLPPVLVNRIFEQVYRQTDVSELLRQLRKGFAPLEGHDKLCPLLYKEYQAQGFRVPPRQEVQAVGKLLQRVDHHNLRLLYAYWTGQRKSLHRELERLSEEEYRAFVETVLHFGFVEPFALLIPGRGDLFLDLYLAAGTIDNLVALVEALLATGEVTYLSGLIPYLPKRPARELRALEKSVNKQPNVPEQFQRSLSEATAALPPTRGIQGFLQGNWTQAVRSLFRR